MQLDTDRLILRPIAPEDAVLYAALWSDPRVYAAVVEDGPVPVGGVPTRVARAVVAWTEGTAATWTLLDDDGPVGFVALEGLGGVVKLRGAVVPRRQRRGLGREALVAVLGAARALGVSAIEAEAPSEAAAALLGSVGFVEIPGAQPRRLVWTAPLTAG